MSKTRGELIIEATQSGLFTEFYRAGIVSQKVIMYRDMYFDVQAVMQTSKCSQSVAVQEVADKYKVDSVTVYRACKFMKG